MGISHGHPKPNFLKTETHQHAFPSENQPPSEFASVQSQESQSFGLVGSCGNYIEAGIKFFLFFCPYNIFFFFWAVLVFVAARRLSAGVVHKLLTEGASLVEHRLQSVRA